ncbi:MAG: hypothetical protein PVI86_18435 [Phycisphaerae bacterium]
MMIRIGRFALLLGVPVGVAVLAASCRDVEPPPAHARDLGSNGEILLPTGSQWRHESVVTGQAEWQPFRALPTGDEPETPPEPQGEGDEATAEIETEVRDLIEGYNEVVSDGTTEELLEYYVEEQHEAIQPWLEATAALGRKRSELRDAFDEKLPDAKDRLDVAFAALEASEGPALTLEKLTVNSATDVTATVGGGGGGRTFRFTLVEFEDGEDWFIELPQVEALAADREATDAARTTYEQWLQGLQTGGTPAETILTQVEEAAEAAAAPPEKAPEAGGDVDAAPVEETTDEERPAPAAPSDGGTGEGGG